MREHCCVVGMSQLQKARAKPRLQGRVERAGVSAGAWVRYSRVCSAAAYGAACKGSKSPGIHRPGGASPAHWVQVTTLLSKVDEVEKLPRLSAEQLAELRAAVEAQGGVVKEAKAAAAANKVLWAGMCVGGWGG